MSGLPVAIEHSPLSRVGVEVLPEDPVALRRGNGLRGRRRRVVGLAVEEDLALLHRGFAVLAADADAKASRILVLRLCARGIRRAVAAALRRSGRLGTRLRGGRGALDELPFDRGLAERITVLLRLLVH